VPLGRKVGQIKMPARQSSAVDKALKLISKGLTPYAAARKVGIALSTIYRAQKRLKASKPVKSVL
jgi:DNA invertase Pin-like site-specific DNA recombinase